MSVGRLRIDLAPVHHVTWNTGMCRNDDIIVVVLQHMLGLLLFKYGNIYIPPRVLCTMAAPSEQKLVLVGCSRLV